MKSGKCQKNKLHQAGAYTTDEGKHAAICSALRAASNTIMCATRQRGTEHVPLHPPGLEPASRKLRHCSTQALLRLSGTSACVPCASLTMVWQPAGSSQQRHANNVRVRARASELCLGLVRSTVHAELDKAPCQVQDLGAVAGPRHPVHGDAMRATSPQLRAEARAHEGRPRCRSAAGLHGLPDGVSVRGTPLRPAVGHPQDRQEEGVGHASGDVHGVVLPPAVGQHPLQVREVLQLHRLDQLHGDAGVQAAGSAAAARAVEAPHGLAHGVLPAGALQDHLLEDPRSGASVGLTERVVLRHAANLGNALQQIRVASVESDNRDDLHEAV
mmetsp:Transcript_86529/g.253290  ORF Transcript_86529/g.253290 Transcript_86529/m.253290 type:complete len:329 (+) Transcript_86529:68-1054(+)